MQTIVITWRGAELEADYTATQDSDDTGAAWVEVEIEALRLLGTDHEVGHLLDDRWPELEARVLEAHLTRAVRDDWREAA